MQEDNVQGQLLGKYVPPKEWLEITCNEKIERMREIIKGLQQAVGRSQTDIHKIKKDFRKHSHLEGEIVVPYDEYNGSGLVGESAKLANKNYF